MPNNALIIFEESQNSSVNLPTAANNRRNYQSPTSTSVYVDSKIDGDEQHSG